MWKAYERLFGEQLSTSPGRIEFLNHKSLKNVDPSADVRDAFKAAWSNWERCLAVSALTPRALLAYSLSFTQ